MATRGPRRSAEGRIPLAFTTDGLSLGGRVGPWGGREMTGPVLRLACLLSVAVASRAPAFIDSPDHPVGRYTLPAMLKNSWVAVLRVDRVDLDRGVVAYELVRTLQGRDWPGRVRHAV